MITFSNQLILTKELYTAVCRYAQKVIIKDFLTKFTFTDSSKHKSQYIVEDINSILESLNLNQGDFYPETEEYVENFISEFLEQLDESNKVALHYLVIDSNYDNYYDGFINNEGESISDEKKTEKVFGRQIAYKIYDPIDSDFEEDVYEFLKGKIWSFSNEIDLSLINDTTIAYLLEKIEDFCVENDVFYL